MQKEYCHICEAGEQVFTEGECTFIYEKAFRDSVIRMKFENRREYLDFYAASMALRHRAFLERIRPEAVIPIPMHKQKKKERGYDQCLLLARRFCRLTGIPMRGDVLVRNRATKPQKGLNRQERRANLQGAFSCACKDFTGNCVLLLDDIFTTGSTVNEAAGVLREAGVEKVYFIALCTERDSG